MADDTTTPAARPEPDRAHSSFRSNAAPAASVTARTTGGSGVQRSHLRDRKAWLKTRTRAGRTWAERKAASATYCPSKALPRERAAR